MLLTTEDKEGRFARRQTTHQFAEAEATLVSFVRDKIRWVRREIGVEHEDVAI